MITKLTAENYKAFSLSEKNVIILCDAEWNNNKELAKLFRELSEKNSEYAFGEVDTDDEGLWEFLRDWKVVNVPCVLYIWNDIPLRDMITGNHNIEEKLSRYGCSGNTSHL